MFVGVTAQTEARDRLVTPYGNSRIMPGVEIHARSPEGKVVVTLEDDDTEAAANRYVALHGVPGVAAVAMVYQYSDEESDTEEVEA